MKRSWLTIRKMAAVHLLLFILLLLTEEQWKYLGVDWFTLIRASFWAKDIFLGYGQHLAVSQLHRGHFLW